MVESLTPEQIAEIREQFALFDKDGDGSITTKEVSEIIGSLGMEADEGEIDEMIRTFDIHGNGEIDFQEFLEVMASRVVQTNQEQVVKDVFTVFDMDSKGYVNQDDLRRVMEQLGEDTEDIKDLFGAADVNGDGTIDYDEFLELMTATI